MGDGSNHTDEDHFTYEDLANDKPVKWADRAQFWAEPHDTADEGGVQPKVYVLGVTHDPLGHVAAASALYGGRVVRDLDELTRNDRIEAFNNTFSHLGVTPLEFVDVHLLLEGVDRAFTHQEVRQRTATFVQESMRFAVLQDLLSCTTLPPSLVGTKQATEGSLAADPPAEREQRWRLAWDECLGEISRTYEYLVNDGMPAEEARGLIPHCVATRIHHRTNLKELGNQAGNRLCTQAQFHWRLVFSLIANGIKEWGYIHDPDNAWQYKMIAQSQLFSPVCYKKGECPMTATFDRPCNIRDRVDEFARLDIPSEEWINPPRMPVGEGEPPRPIVDPINPAEWLLTPDAAREQ